MKPEEVLAQHEVENENKIMLIGKFTGEDLQQASYFRWFNNEYESFNLSQNHRC